MIEAIYQFGKLLKNKSQPSCQEELSADELIILDFDSKGNLVDISSTRDFSGIANKLLFKRVRASRRCNSDTPTFYINLQNPEKSVSCLKAIFSHLKQYNREVPEPKDYEQVSKSLKEYLSQFSRS